MTDSPNLALPYILPAQAQKHVTHNEAIRFLDCLVQLAVENRTLTVPPVSPAEGARYLVAAGATGAWSGRSGKIAAFQDGAWNFYAPQDGWIAWIKAESLALVSVSGTWSALAPAGVTDHGMLTGLGDDDHAQYHTDARGDARYTPINPTTLGINATADTTNRLALSSPASLFNNAGNGHQVKVNKNAAGDTASFLFQTGFSGRAEIGTTGDDDFHFKVSPNGSTFYEAIKINKSTGEVTFPAVSQVDVQRFTASGTWTKPSGAKSVRVILTGGGAGAGGGGKASSGTAVSGGGGGGGGGRIDQVFDASIFGSSETITVGGGGSGGAGATSTGAPGSNGAAGGNSSFGSVVTAYGGGFGSGGNASVASAGGAGGSMRGAGGNASGSTAGTNGISIFGANGASGANSATVSTPTGGGGGGGGLATGVAGNANSAVCGGGGGASGGGVTSTNIFQVGGQVTNALPGVNSGGASDGAGGIAGGGSTTIAGFGGSGGAGSVSSTGGAGGAGGAPGGGGGGGGASQGGNGGAGGAGGRGEVLIITYR